VSSAPKFNASGLTVHSLLHVSSLFSTTVPKAVGETLGLGVGNTLGAPVGSMVGIVVGQVDGQWLGVVVGSALGVPEGAPEGIPDGTRLPLHTAGALKCCTAVHTPSSTVNSRCSRAPPSLTPQKDHVMLSDKGSHKPIDLSVYEPSSKQTVPFARPLPDARQDTGIPCFKTVEEGSCTRHIINTY